MGQSLSFNEATHPLLDNNGKQLFESFGFVLIDNENRTTLEVVPKDWTLESGGMAEVNWNGTWVDPDKIPQIRVSVTYDKYQPETTMKTFVRKTTEEEKNAFKKKESDPLHQKLDALEERVEEAYNELRTTESMTIGHPMSEHYINKAFEKYKEAKKEQDAFLSDHAELK